MSNCMYPKINPMDEKKINKFLRVTPYAQSTKRSYSWMLKRLCRWLGKAQLDMADLDDVVMLNFLDDQTTWGQNMKNLALMATKAYVKYAYGEDHPLISLRLRKPSMKPQRTLDEDEIIQLIRYLEEKVRSANTDMRFNRAIRNLAMVCLLLDAGLRSSELCGLKINDVDLEKRVLQVLVKGGSWEYGKFSAYTSANLEDWLTVRLGIAAPGTPYVFVGILGSTPGEQMTTSGLRSIFRKMARRAGLSHFSTHTFRRSGATLATKSGGPDRTVRMAWRWKSPQQLDRYTQMLPLDTIDPFLPLNQIDTESIRVVDQRVVEPEAYPNVRKPGENSKVVFIE